MATESWIFNDLGFGKNLTGTLTGSIGILTWDGRRGSVEVIQDDWHTPYAAYELGKGVAGKALEGVGHGR